MTKLLIFSVLHITSTFFNAKINKYIIKSSSLNKYFLYFHYLILFSFPIFVVNL